MWQKSKYKQNNENEKEIQLIGNEHEENEMGGGGFIWKIPTEKNARDGKRRTITKKWGILKNLDGGDIEWDQSAWPRPASLNKYYTAPAYPLRAALPHGWGVRLRGENY